MFKENFKKRLFSSTWRISVAHGMIHMNLHVACLNVILNILPSCISGFRCRPSVTTKIGTHSFRGFINYAKDSFIKKYKIHCEVTNCYTCMRN